MSLWANIHKKRQRIKQGSGEKMRKKGDKGAPTPDQLKRAKGEEMEEGKMKQAQMRRQDMAKLAGLYSKAMKAMPGSPKQKELKKQIDQYRRELGLKEYGGPPISRKDYLKQKPMNPKLDETVSAALHIKGMRTAKAHAKKDGANLKDKDLMNKYFIYHMKKNNRMTHFKKDANGNLDFNSIGKGTKIEPKHYRDIFNKTKKESLEEAVKTTLAKELNIDKKDVDKLKALMVMYTRAMKIPSGSPKHDALSREISKLRKDLNMNESVDEGSDMYVVYKKKGFSKIKALANLKSMPKGKMLDKVLDKYNADGVIAVSAIKRRGLTVEAVSPAQQAAIAISKKERGEKPKKEEVKYPHMMYDPKTGKGYKAENPKDHERMAKMGYTHDKPEVNEAIDPNILLPALFGAGLSGGILFVGGLAATELYLSMGGRKLNKRLKQKYNELKAKLKNKNYKPSKTDIETGKELGKEVKKLDPSAYKKAQAQVSKAKKDSKLQESRAYRDAMRGMSARSATRGMATTKKDKDTEATDDDRKAASKNIIMQLRKAADLPTGAEVEFERGKGKVTRDQAQGALARFNALAKPRDKEAFQKSIRSLSDIKKILGR